MKIKHNYYGMPIESHIMYDPSIINDGFELPSGVISATANLSRSNISKQIQQSPTISVNYNKSESCVSVA